MKTRSILGMMFFVSYSAYAAPSLKPISIEFRSDGKAVISTHDIEDASATKDATSRKWEVAVHFTPEASARFQKFTGEHIGQHLSIILDGKELASPVIQGEIAGGHAALQGNFSKKEAEKIVTRIKEANQQKK